MRKDGKVVVVLGGQERELKYRVLGDRPLIEKALGKQAISAFMEGLFGAPAGTSFDEFTASYEKKGTRWFMERHDPEVLAVFLEVALRQDGETVREWICDYAEAGGGLPDLALAVMDAAYLYSLFNVRIDIESLSKVVEVLVGKAETSSEPSTSEPIASSENSSVNPGSTDAQAMA